MHLAVEKLSGSAVEAPAEEAPTEYTPAVTVRKSLASKDHIISLIDGKPYRTLRRHLTSNGLTPEEYRARYNLKADYPIVAESYSEARRAMAGGVGRWFPHDRVRLGTWVAPCNCARHPGSCR